MSRSLHTQLHIDAPAEEVWQLIGPQFDRVGEWASAIPQSAAALEETPACPAAPVAGRSCESSIPGMPSVSELITHYDDDAMELTYLGTSGMPKFVARATNTWRVERDGPHACLVTVAPTFTGNGAVGRFLCAAMRPMLRRIGRVTLEDLAHYVEHGSPSPSKVRQVTRAARPAATA